MIFHVVPLDDWLRDPDRPYAPPTLASDGFVHCSPDEKSALTVADTFYREAVGPLMVLLIDEAALDTPVRWEPPTPSPPPGTAPGTLFPHVYGRVNRTAVAGMLEVERDADGHAVSLRLWS
ncbi:DUF952 domain-containing protein [Streptomyces sp. ICBB 8177]|uniref:DUF952 domain-containing protein n=1 Tax=Streptomyces sp. ICBB 8177 TaxID=563922 RepID=UPI000D67906F|nr:DUF952 domain-containing protein [Streptomyces sp. ICBB 8177]PWI41800.1 hypothetical protein CK485_23575 [Streptomyces sp. ICBB 8177]